MAPGNAVTLTFAGDSTSLDKTTAQVTKDLASLKSHTDATARSFRAEGNDFNESAGKVSKTAKGTKDTIKGLTDGLGMLGISFPGEQALGMAQVIFDLSKGAKDLAEGLGGALSGGLSKIKGLFGMATAATEAQTVATEGAEGAQAGLNVAMDANPIGLLVAAAAALAIGFYELWQHSETFRNGVKALGRDAVAAFHGIESAASIVGNAITGAFKAAFNFVASAWDDTVGQLSFHIPSWVPGIGGDGFSMPTIPHFATGGSFNGLAMVGEHGPELIAGSGNVIPMSRAGVGGAGTPVIIDFTGLSSDLLIEAMRRGVRTRGGNVQTVLGSNS